MNDAAPPPSPPIKDTIDANPGRFEFLKQTLTLGLAGIGGVAALFTDPSRVPSDTFSKWVLVLAGAGLVFVVAFAVMGLSPYANLLTVSAKISRNTKDVEKYSKGVRDHARVVIIALSVALAGTITFAVNRLFAPPTTPEGAVTDRRRFRRQGNEAHYRHDPFRQDGSRQRHLRRDVLGADDRQRLYRPRREEGR